MPLFIVQWDRLCGRVSWGLEMLSGLLKTSPRQNLNPGLSLFKVLLFALYSILSPSAKRPQEMWFTSVDLWRVSLLSFLSLVNVAPLICLSGLRKHSLALPPVTWLSPPKWRFDGQTQLRRNHCGQRGVGSRSQSSLLSKLLWEHQLWWGTHFINCSLNNLDSKPFKGPSRKRAWSLEKLDLCDLGETVS